jgi:hypothetical protein
VPLAIRYIHLYYVPLHALPRGVACVECTVYIRLQWNVIGTNHSKSRLLCFFSSSKSCQMMRVLKKASEKNERIRQYMHIEGTRPWGWIEQILCPTCVSSSKRLCRFLSKVTTRVEDAHKIRAATIRFKRDLACVATWTSRASQTHTAHCMFRTYWQNPS